VASQVVKLMIKRNFGKWSYCFDVRITFKENCPDVRNTKIVDVIALTDYGIAVTTYDPIANPLEVKKRIQLSYQNELPKQQFDAVILGVAHDQF
jgi:UDP-N-acetyl-D-galactosamine dehydrogenase